VNQSCRGQLTRAGKAAITAADPGLTAHWPHRADQVAFSGRSGRRVIEPGEICVGIGGASDNLPLTGSFSLHGPERTAGADRVLHTESSISPV
jgi:beta-xylosidase